MTAYTVPVRQAAELFKQAGFPYSEDHISRLCKQGVLRATQQTTKNKLKRYVIDPRSIQEQIERLRREKEEREHPQVFEAMPETAAERRYDDDTDGGATVVSLRHHDDHERSGVSPSFPAPSYEWRGDGESAAELRGELRALKEQARKEAAKIENLEKQNAGLRITLGQFKGKSETLEKQLLQLTAPKPAEPEQPTPTAAHDDTTAASTPTSWWRRTFG
jgi:predicted RNase H-like nuclease (RuvC/YqgF family)